MRQGRHSFIILLIGCRFGGPSDSGASRSEIYPVCRMSVVGHDGREEEARGRAYFVCGQAPSAASTDLPDVPFALACLDDRNAGGNDLVTKKLVPAPFAASVSALASLVALVLLWQRHKPEIMGDLPIMLAMLACGVAVLASLGVMLIVLRTPRQHRVSGTSGADPSERYRLAVQMAWADGTLSRPEGERLDQLEGDLGLGRDRTGEIEREITGGTREELVSTKDSPPIDKPWIDLVEECVGIVKDLDRHMSGFDPARQELADHVILSLAEGLERAGVDIISDDETFDRKRHEPAEAKSRTAPGATVVETLSPGFAVGRRVLRRARVRVE